MTTIHSRKLFVDLPVRDLSRSMEFFSMQFTNHEAACMIVSDEAFVMLLAEICDTATHTEGLFALSCESRAEVDELLKTAVAAGGRHALDPQDHGFMYGWSFHDPDGHHWEVLWMDPKTIAQ